MYQDALAALAGGGGGAPPAPPNPASNGMGAPPDMAGLPPGPTGIGAMPTGGPGNDKKLAADVAVLKLRELQTVAPQLGAAIDSWIGQIKSVASAPGGAPGPAAPAGAPAPPGGATAPVPPVDLSGSPGGF